MPRTHRLGTDAVFARNSATWATPTWVTMKAISDGSANVGWDTKKLNLRLSRTPFEVPTEFAVGFTGKMLDDESADFTAMDDAFNAGTPLDILVLNGPISRAKSRGFRMWMFIKKWDEAQGSGDVLMRDFELVPALPEDQTQLPQRAVVVTANTVTLTPLAPQ